MLLLTIASFVVFFGAVGAITSIVIMVRDLGVARQQSVDAYEELRKIRAELHELRERHAVAYMPPSPYDLSSTRRKKG